MTTQAIERVEQWETRSFEGGYLGLQTLADRSFSGVVRATGGTLCMLNGTVVGVVGGTIEDFEDADGTAYVAPTPALPLLIVMQERSDEVRAKYYTEDTPLSKVDSTLSDGGFTGFIELSENVLSGDYYVVYHSGRSMSVAFVGESAQLLAEDEAFQRADDEVGIYEVRPVDIEPIEIPEPATASETTGAAAGTTDTADAEQSEAADDSTATETDGERSDQDESEASVTEETAPSASAAGTDTSADESDAGAAAASNERATEDESTAETSPEPPAETSSEPPSETSVEPAAASSTESSASHSSGASSAETSETESTTTESSPDSSPSSDTATRGGVDRADRSAESNSSPAESTQHPGASGTESNTADTGSTANRSSTSREQSPDPAAQRRASAGQSPGADRPRDAGTDSTDRSVGSAPSRSGESRSSGSAADLETRTIPSLDPERSWNGDERERQPDVPSGGPVPTPSASESAPSSDQRTTSRSPTTEAAPSTEPTAGGQTGDQRRDTPATSSSEPEPAPEPESEPTTDSQTVADLRETIADREQRIESLETDLETARRERDELETERDDLQAELDRLQSQLSDLREERDTLKSRLDGIDDEDVDTPERRLGQREALDGTDLFVRYASKGDPTLKSAYESGASRADVNQNLDVESHTQFETDGTVVSGDPFESFLHSTVEHRYVSWVVRQLLFEIRDTGHQDALADLYDALPRIDRVELNGVTTVEYTEDGQTKRSQESFDVVLRDRMGNPLVVANINDSRQAATEDQMSSLVTAATRVGESNPSLAAAMFVTSSFFEPGALETAADATGGGLLSRDKRESYVKISRKQGFHLCLVEAREEQFHMAVPEL